jgi:hypothetical protein
MKMEKAKVNKVTKVTKGKDNTKGKKSDPRNKGTKFERKKGQPSWKNVEAEIETLNKRITAELPAPGILYYKYKPDTKNPDDEAEKAELPSTTIANRKIIETSDKERVKIRFSDLPISKASVNGLFKAKFVKMTDV